MADSQNVISLEKRRKQSKKTERKMNADTIDWRLAIDFIPARACNNNGSRTAVNRRRLMDNKMGRGLTTDPETRTFNACARLAEVERRLKEGPRRAFFATLLPKRIPVLDGLSSRMKNTSI